MNIKLRPNTTFFLLLTIIVSVSACDVNKTIEYSVDGKYSLVSGLQQNSKERIILEEFINFSCPHCYSTHGRMKALQTKYGKQLIIISRPVVKRGSDESVLRLFHIARKLNKEPIAIETFYSANFERNLDLYDPEVVINLAEELGLKNEYLKMRNSEWVSYDINADFLLASSYQIEGTPSWVIEQQLKVKTNFNNLEVVINSLLVK